MESKKLNEVREYELNREKSIPKGERPLFHLSSRVGWMNDPNGFSFYKDKYHLFYQYYPYKSIWGPMHWGHATSKDLILWEYEPAVLAPDEEYDNFGCFSGTAITLGDRHLLMYTSVKTKVSDGEKKEFQQQSIAFGDGINYEKYKGNPVISTDQIPKGFSVYDFRDPKIWQGSDGAFRAIIGARDENQMGCILLYKSIDCKNWTFKKVFAKNDGTFGTMWECPDFFVLDGRGVLIVSPMEMKERDFEYPNGNATLCFIGDYDEKTDEFIIKNSQAIDCGIDFYAPESTETTQCGRVMVGWMQNWETSNDHDKNIPFFGQMSLPRELSIKDGRLYQWPVKELKKFRKNKVVHRDVLIDDNEISLDGIFGRYIEMDVKICPETKGDMYDEFIISMAKNHKFHTDFIFYPKKSLVELDRSFCGFKEDKIKKRSTGIDNKNGILKAKFILDKNSIEVFLEDGRKVFTAVIPTENEALNISFKARGKAKIDVEKYEISI